MARLGNFELDSWNHYPVAEQRLADQSDATYKSIAFDGKHGPRTSLDIILRTRNNYNFRDSYSVLNRISQKVADLEKSPDNKKTSANVAGYALSAMFLTADPALNPLFLGDKSSKKIQVDAAIIKTNESVQSRINKKNALLRKKCAEGISVLYATGYQKTLDVLTDEQSNLCHDEYEISTCYNMAGYTTYIVREALATEIAFYDEVSKLT
ncbi:MAG: hypothetical protein WAW80_01270 [Candidatus Saccharimonadales bacterium]